MNTSVKYALVLHTQTHAFIIIPHKIRNTRYNTDFSLPYTLKVHFSHVGIGSATSSRTATYHYLTQ